MIFARTVLGFLAPLALLALSTSGAALAFGALTTFQVRGHMIWSSGPDLQEGDAFTATYTFDDTVESIGSSEGIDAYYWLAIKDWRFTFEKGYDFAAASSDAGAIILVNNNVEYSYDRYLAELFNVKSIGAVLPSGREVEYIQFYFDDFEPAGNPDLLSDIALPTAPPSIELSSYATGRLVLNEALDDFGQPQFAVESIALVPEPITATNFWAMGAALIAPAASVGKGETYWRAAVVLTRQIASSLLIYMGPPFLLSLASIKGMRNNALPLTRPSSVRFAATRPP